MDLKPFQSLMMETRVRPEMFGKLSLDFLGRKYVPDDSKGYVKFALGHAFPVLCERGCLHAGTVANSWPSMEHQGLNYDHRVKAYFDSGSNIEDRYIGCILAADYPRMPMSGWRLTSYEEAPGITCVASVFKAAQGVGKIVGEHQTGRHEWTVSMEMNHDVEEAGVVMFGKPEEFKALSAGEQKLVAENTPKDFEEQGFGYLPLSAVADDFVAYWSKELMKFDKKWKGRNLSLMFGGLNGKVHFKGTGVVKYGAEPTARLDLILANKEGKPGEEGASGEEAVAEVWRAIGRF